MTIDALTSRIEHTSISNLETALIDTYKMVPAEKTEQLDKVLDQLLGESAPPLDPKKLDRLEKTVFKFTENAMNGNYLYPNSKVPKAKRLTWAHDIGAILDKMDSTEARRPGFERVAPLYSLLYQTLSEGLLGDTFPERDPFQALNYPQEILLRSMVIANLEADNSVHTLRNLIRVICSCPANRKIGHRKLQRYLLPQLSAWDALEDALQEAMSLSEESIQQLGPTRNRCTDTSLYAPLKQDTAFQLADLVLQIALAISPEKYLSCLDFFYDHAMAPNEDSMDSVLARALETIDEQWELPEYEDEDENDNQPEIDEDTLERTWIIAYEDGLERGIQPDEDLQEQYKVYKKHATQEGTAE